MTKKIAFKTIAGAFFALVMSHATVFAAPNAEQRMRDLIDETNRNTISIISGNPAGTYLSVAYDISAVLDEEGVMRVLPIVGKAAAQNTKDLLFLRGVDMAITQSNILSYFRRNNELGDITSRIVYIAKLFNEEFHLVVTKDIKTLADLNGKAVNFSDAGSGTQYTAREVFSALGVKVREVNMGQNDALEQMRNGEIAGTVQIVGKPANGFSRITKESGFHLLPIPYVSKLQDDYFPAVISAEDYPNMLNVGQEVETVAVGAVLAAYNWPENTERYQRLERFVGLFFKKFSEFQKAPRHSKWQEVNLGAVLPRWQRFAPAQAWLDEARAGRAPASATQAGTTGSVRPAANTTQQEQALRDEFEQFLTSQPGLRPADEKDREQLFEQFKRWRQESVR